MRELYDEVCEVLTWYEHPEESPLDENDVVAEMYDILVKVQNKLAEEYGY